MREREREKAASRKILLACISVMTRSSTQVGTDPGFGEIP